MGIKYNLSQKVKIGTLEFRESVSDVSIRIPEDERRVIFERITTIAGADYSTLSDEAKQNIQISATEGGATAWDDKSAGYQVRIDIGTFDLEEIKHRVAHEFGHVFCDHYRKGVPPSAIAEEEVRVKIKEWGF